MPGIQPLLVSSMAIGRRSLGQTEKFVLALPFNANLVFPRQLADRPLNLVVILTGGFGWLGGAGLTGFTQRFSHPACGYAQSLMNSVPIQSISPQ
jgi:hypothetical protein